MWLPTRSISFFISAVMLCIAFWRVSAAAVTFITRSQPLPSIFTEGLPPPRKSDMFSPSSDAERPKQRTVLVTDTPPQNSESRDFT